MTDKLTVKEIKEKIKEIGKQYGKEIKAPNGLIKKNLIQYYINLCYALQQNLPITIQTNTGESLNYEGVYQELLDYKVIDENNQEKIIKETWIQHLYRKGWCTVPIPDFDNTIITSNFLSWLEKVSNESGAQFNRNDSSTWNYKNLPMNYHGILKNYIGHEEFIWETREKCYPLFQELWQTEDLLCSFDGGCFLPYKNRNQVKSWIHNDHSRLRGDTFCCVQGLVNLLDNGNDDGGLLLLEGSQKIYGNYLNRHPVEGFIAHYRADMCDLELSQCSPIKVCAPSGHLILWDSRTFHCNVPPKIENSLRMCIYVCMMPSSYCSDKDRRRRIEAFEKLRMTGHWCYGDGFNICSEHPRTYGNNFPRPNKIEVPELNPLRRKLIGYF